MGITFVFHFLALVHAAPPVDLTDPAAGETKKERALTEDDLVYTDVGQPLPDPKQAFATVLIEVAGRSLPGRQGRPLFPLKKGDKVQLLRASKDGRWWAIMALRQRRKAWLPQNALKLPTPAPAVNPPPPPGLPRSSGYGPGGL